MSSSRFATYLRVTPAPTTLAESSAIYKSLKSQARLTHFIKHRHCDSHARPDHDSASASTTSATYYAIFQHSPPPLTTHFKVPVYHNLRSPRDQDPFNIRGLQDRKPFPAPRTFTCQLERVAESDGAIYDALKQANPHYGSFEVAREDWLQTVYAETGAPSGVKEGLGLLVHERAGDEITVEGPQQQQQLPQNTRIPTGRTTKERRWLRRRAAGKTLSSPVPLDGLMRHWEDGQAEANAKAAHRTSGAVGGRASRHTRW